MTKRQQRVDDVGGYSSASSPMGHAQRMLIRVIPHEFVNEQHYDQRRIQCVLCGYVPKKRALLQDSDQGYVCKATGACAKRTM